MALDRFSEKVAFKITVWEGNVRRRLGPRETDAETGFKNLTDYFIYLADSWAPFSVCGWKQMNNQCEPYKSLCGVDRLHKDRMNVYHINESDHPYHSGHEIATFFADNRESLERFCDDWDFDKSGIIEDTEVQQYF